MARVLRLFDLIVAHEPGRWGFREALRIVKNLLPNALVFDAPRNLLLLKTGDPFRAVEVLRGNLDSDAPILRAVPLNGVALGFVEDVVEALEELRGMVEGRPRFAVRLEGRLLSRETGEPVSSRKAVEAIAGVFDLPVDLSNPELLVLVKVVRLGRGQRYAGLMLAPPSAVYSRAKLSQ